MPAKHLEGMTKYNEAGSLRGMNNKKLWDEINIFQKIYLFLLFFVNTSNGGVKGISGSTTLAFQSNSSKYALHLHNAVQLTCDFISH